MSSTTSISELTVSSSRPALLPELLLRLRGRRTGRAAPLAARTGIEVTLYDPRDLAAFADELIATPGRHLVVGHSNTTPQLAEALGGEPGSEINEASEYDRLYVITLSGSGVSSEIRRYGVRDQGNAGGD